LIQVRGDGLHLPGKGGFHQGNHIRHSLSIPRPVDLTGLVETAHKSILQDFPIQVNDPDRDFGRAVGVGGGIRQPDQISDFLAVWRPGIFPPFLYQFSLIITVWTDDVQRIIRVLAAGKGDPVPVWRPKRVRIAC
jgi:hypothetical protein